MNGMVQAQPVIVYVDQLLLLNLLVNYLILWAVQGFLALSARWWRLLLAALIGSFYTLAVVVTGEKVLLSWEGKLLLPAAMVALSFMPLSWRKFFLSYLLFFLFSFALGGVIWGVGYFYTSGGFLVAEEECRQKMMENFWAILMVAVTFYYLTVRTVQQWWQRRQWQGSYLASIQVRWFGREVDFMGLIDTGCNLRDYLTGEPVIVVEVEAIRGLFAPNLQLELEKAVKGEDSRFFTLIGTTPLRARFRYLPYRGLGQEGGLLLCFRPDEVIISSNSYQRRWRRALIALAGQKLDPHGMFQALVSPLAVG